MTASKLEPRDEELHPVGEGEHWQESWYFNWTDPRHDVFGLTRIGFNFRQNKIDGLIVTIRNGRPEYVYPSVNVPYRKPWSEQTAARGLRARQLVYKVEEPLKSWRLTLQGRNTMDLHWEGFTPVFDFHSEEGELAPNVAGRHFEQSGRVTGTTYFKGKRLEINGTGHRDKSWGVRDWANVEGWNWISAQFGQEMSFNVTEMFYGGKRYVNGFVFYDGKNRPVREVNNHFHWGRRKHVPSSMDIEIIDASGGRMDVTAQALGHFPLIKKGLWIQETHARFTASSAGTIRNGFGVIEHAWHAGRLKALARAPELFRTAAQVLGR